MEMHNKGRPMNPEQFMKRQQSYLVDGNKDPREHTLEVLDKNASVSTYAVLGEHAGEDPATVHSACFSPDDKYVAVAKNNGEVIVYNVAKPEKRYALRNKERKSPFTMVKWRGPSDYFSTSNVLGTVNSDGQIQHWHMATGKLISSIQENFGEDSQLFAFDYAPGFKKQAVCGAHPTIRVYDMETCKRIHNLEGAHSLGDTGHTNRVYSVRFFKDDDTRMVSGGWDNKIVFWDLRQEKPIHTMMNRMICGDSIDLFEGGIMLSCSWQDKDQIQLINLNNYKPLTSSQGDRGIAWEPATKKSKKKNQEEKQEGNPRSTYLTTCRIDRECHYFLAGGAFRNEARVFSVNHTVCKITGMVREVLTCDWSYDNSKFLIGGADGFVRIFNIRLPAPQEED